MMDFVTEQEKIACAIVTKLQTNGFQAFFVGGYVRDLLYKQIFDDSSSSSRKQRDGNRVLSGISKKGTRLNTEIDIATGALPNEVLSLFADTRDYGKAYGSVVVKQDGYRFEVTTFRKDGIYSDGRRPEKVTFVKDVKQDAKRRDFTMNALYLDPITNELLDFFNGVEDVQQKRLRFISDDIDDQIIAFQKRVVHEDYLRLVRALRFMIQFNLTVSDEVLQEMLKYKDLIQKITPEVVRQEIKKIDIEKCTEKEIKMLKEFGLYF